jgi:hypothetical protein
MEECLWARLAPPQRNRSATQPLARLAPSSIREYANKLVSKGAHSNAISWLTPYVNKRDQELAFANRWVIAKGFSRGNFARANVWAMRFMPRRARPLAFAIPVLFGERANRGGEHCRQKCDDRAEQKKKTSSCGVGRLDYEVREAGRVGNEQENAPGESSAAPN